LSGVAVNQEGGKAIAKEARLAAEDGFGTRDGGDLYLRFAQTLLN